MGRTHILCPYMLGPLVLTGTQFGVLAISGAPSVSHLPAQRGRRTVCGRPGDPCWFPRRPLLCAKPAIMERPAESAISSKFQGRYFRTRSPMELALRNADVFAFAWTILFNFA